jgi:hypothetical protein
MRRVATPAELLAAFDCNVEPSHYPHMTRALTEQHLDAKQAERDTATTPLGELLLSSGAVEGPYRNPHPITRWRLIGRRISTALAALARAL